MKKTRTQKKDKHTQVWEQLIATPQYQQGLKERYKIERKFGEAKEGHGLGRCRSQTLRVSWQGQVRNPGILYRHHPQPEADREAADRCWLQMSDFALCLTRGEMSMLVEIRVEKGGCASQI